MLNRKSFIKNSFIGLAALVVAPVKLLEVIKPAQEVIKPTQDEVLFLTGSKTVSWPSNIMWAGGEAPSLTAGGTDAFTFFTDNGGTTWYGMIAGQNMT